MSEHVERAGLLYEWESAFDALNQCPWPGPKPIDNDPRQLRGRRRGIVDLATSCLTNDLVVIRGESGVGKSSLLKSGLIPELERQNKIVLYCNSWDGEAASWEEAAQHAADRAQFRGPQNPFAGVATELPSRFPDKLVIVLDQFEEAIRNSRWLAHHTLKWVEQTAGTTAARFVISLRSEHEHELSTLYTKPFAKRERIEIPPVNDPRAVKLIIEGRTDDPADAMPIEAQATEHLLRAWDASQELDFATAWERPGLLHLQAALYVLWMLRPSGQSVVTGQGVKDLLLDCATQRGLPETEALKELLGYALEKSVEVAVDKCTQACASVDVPLATVNQTKWVFRDITGHLSSGGYKTPQHMWTLAPLIIGVGAEDTCNAVMRIVEPIFADEDWLGVQRADHTTALLGIRGQNKQLGSGPASGLYDTEVMFELFRCYFFALKWLTTSNVARLERANNGRYVSLTHDRYEQGLERWRHRERESFKEAVERLTSLRGEDKSWQDVSGYDAYLTPERTNDDNVVGIGAGQRLVVNVNWRSCKITSSDFTDIAFVNCDFQGSTFFRCAFSGATFVNCVLDQVDFVSCLVRGEATYPQKILDDIPANAPVVSEPPTFSMNVPVALARFLGALKPGFNLPAAATSAHLAVPESGLPAVPQLGLAKESDVRESAALPIVPGGLSMCGGRLSSLTFRRCEFGADGVVNFRHVVGSSLEICEQRSGKFRIFAAGIRALAVTLPIEDLTADALPDAPPLELYATQVRIVNGWFGTRLRGKAVFRNSALWHVINPSLEGFEVDVDDCRWYGLVNTGVPTHSTPLAEKLKMGVESLGRWADEALEFSRKVDFRESVPMGWDIGDSDE